MQVFAASDFQVDPQYLLALLNSKLLTYLFRTRFAAKRLAGGYVAINKGSSPSCRLRCQAKCRARGRPSLAEVDLSMMGRSSSAKDCRPPDGEIDQRSISSTA